MLFGLQFGARNSSRRFCFFRVRALVGIGFALFGGIHTGGFELVLYLAFRIDPGKPRLLPRG